MRPIGIVLGILFLVLSGCYLQMQVQDGYVITIDYQNGMEASEVFFPKGERLDIDVTISRPGYVFSGWWLDQVYTIPVSKEQTFDADTTIYAKWDREEYSREYYVDGTLYLSSCMPHGAVYTVGQPEKSGYRFVGWSINGDGEALFDTSAPYLENLKLHAVWEPVPFTITYEYGFDTFQSKDDLYVSFFSDFYGYMKEYTDAEFEKYGIRNVEDFLAFCKNWNALDKSDLYGVGYAFAEYFVCWNERRGVEIESAKTFIGYCFQNNLYNDFIDHLIEFFAYWRTDEGYTGGPDDPMNIGNDFYACPWASLIDTAKFFYFTSETLVKQYPFFNSQRVNDALDHIPGVLEKTLTNRGVGDRSVMLENIKRDGYTFLGWYDSPDETANRLTSVNYDITVYAKWEKLQ